MIHHRHPLGDPYRVMVGQDDHAKAQADVFGEAAQRAENNFRAGRRRKGGEEVVFDEPHIVEAHFVGQDALLDSFLDYGVVIQSRTLHFVSQAEFHSALSRVRLAGGFGG